MATLKKTSDRSAHALSLWRVPLLLAVLGVTACGAEEHGGVTAQLVWSDGTAGADTAGRSRQGLRAAALPDGIARLEILALDVRGSTLASTTLSSSAPDGANRLEPSGGTWSLDRVPIGKDHQLVGRAYLGPTADPRTSDLLLYSGKITGVEVRSGEQTNAGTLEMRLATDVRYPPLDVDPPSAPAPVTATTIDRGDGLWVSFTRPTEDDLAGYIVAVAPPGFSATPVIERGYQPELGDTLGDDYVVRRIVRSATPEVVSVEELMDGISYRIVVFAYDGDLDNRPLNYSAGAMTVGLATDIVIPGEIVDLAIVQEDTSATVSFTSPGEDDESGTPARYDVRVASESTELQSTASFEALPPVVAPEAKPAGELVRFTRSFAELGVSGALPFYVGVRAVDARGNEGPIAIARYVATSTIVPEIAALEPPIGIAGSLMTVHGSAFGLATGTVSLVTSDVPPVVTTLTVTRWTDSEITALVPAAARSGTLLVARPDAVSVSTFLAVVARFPGVLPIVEAPFELVATDGPSGAVSALYSEVPVGADYEGAIERYFSDDAEGLTLAPYTAADRSTAIAGTYAPGGGQFLFVASTSTTWMSAALVSSSTTVEELRIPHALAAGDADRIGLVALGSLGPEVPAMIAYSSNGVVYTATTADARSAAFGGPWAQTSTTSTSTYDRATIAQSEVGELLLGYRETDDLGSSWLVLAETSSGAFSPIPAPVMPELWETFELVAVPSAGMTTGGLVVAYESLSATGDAEIRVLAVDEYGVSLGYAPFALDVGVDWRLEDAGLVWRDGEPAIAVLAARLDVGAELRYTEVPLAALGWSDASRGLYPGVTLDTSDDTTRARLGCRQVLLDECPIAWIGGNAQVLFLRR